MISSCDISSDSALHRNNSLSPKDYPVFDYILEAIKVVRSDDQGIRRSNPVRLGDHEDLPLITERTVY